MKKIIFLALLLIGLGSCRKEVVSPVHQDEAPAMVSTPVDSSGSTSMGGLKSYIINYTSVGQIPSQFFTSKWAYKNKYVHITQYNNECSWTSYVLCSSAIINGDLGYYYYPVNHTKITSVKNWCGNSYIERLRDYANQKDNTYFWNTYLCKESKNTTGRFNMIKKMLDHIYTYQKPFIAIITHNTIGHYVVVWDIDWKCGVTGSTVYYTDPLDAPTFFMAQVKTMNLTEFLDKMGPLNSYTSSYCALFLR